LGGGFGRLGRPEKKFLMPSKNWGLGSADTADRAANRTANVK